MRKNPPYIFLYKKAKLSQYFPLHYSYLLLYFFLLLISGCKKDSTSADEGPILTYNYNGASYDVKGTLGRDGNFFNTRGVCIGGPNPWRIGIEDGDRTHPIRGCYVTITRTGDLKPGVFTSTGYELGLGGQGHYLIQGTEVNISSLNNNKASGTFSFTAKYDPTFGGGGPSSISVTGTFKNVVVNP